MEPSSQVFASLIRNEVLPQAGVYKLTSTRRFTTVYAQGSPADAVFFLDSGLVKVFKRGEEGKEIILQIVTPGELFGEQALGSDQTRSAGAEVLQDGTIYAIPRQSFAHACDQNSLIWRHVSGLLLGRKHELEKKIELLCMRDVEHRILYYLAELASALAGDNNGVEHSIPISQGELASLIGATRETTSTTLNVLARRGLLRLNRRQLVISSIDNLRAAADNRNMRAVAS